MAIVDQEGLTTELRPTPLYDVPGPEGGMFRICHVASLSSGATSSSSLGVNVISNDHGQDSDIPGPIYSGNSPGGGTQKCVEVFSSASKSIQISTSYASAGEKPMTYALHIRVEAQ